MDQAVEILDGERMIGLLRFAIDSKLMCKMEIPNTKYTWITLILGLDPDANPPYLMVDRVRDFEQAIGLSSSRDIVFEFLEREGVPCQFKTRLLRPAREGLLMEMPLSLFRFQKRRFYRVKARLGTEVIFHCPDGRDERGKVRDYSMGGLAFFIDRALGLDINDRVTDVWLKIPQKGDYINFYNPVAEVRRVERQTRGKAVCVLEFVDMPEATKEQLWRHIFEEQRIALKKTRGS